jgi:hypothetical protein
MPAAGLGAVPEPSRPTSRSSGRWGGPSGALFAGASAAGADCVSGGCGCSDFSSEIAPKLDPSATGERARPSSGLGTLGSAVSALAGSVDLVLEPAARSSLPLTLRAPIPRGASETSDELRSDEDAGARRIRVIDAGRQRNQRKGYPRHWIFGQCCLGSGAVAASSVAEDAKELIIVDASGRTDSSQGKSFVVATIDDGLGSSAALVTIQRSTMVDCPHPWHSFATTRIRCEVRCVGVGMTTEIAYRSGH